MSYISTSRFNWVSTPSAWQSAQIWRAKQQAATASFESSNSDAGSAFFGAAVDFATGMNSIAAKRANARLQQQISQSAVNTFA
jgi:hypothetical protein